MRCLGLYVVRNQVEQVWHLVEPYIARCNTDRTTADDLCRLCATGDRQLWLTLTPEGRVQGGCITCIMDYPHGRALRITTLGGDAVDWEECMADAEHYAATLGCQWLEVQGRRGWLRRLKGYTEEFMLMSKEL